MTPARRKTPALALGLPVLAVIFSSAGLVAPATAAPGLPGAPEVPDSPLAATLEARSATVVTGKKAVLTGTSPTLSLPTGSLPIELPGLPAATSTTPDVALQVKVGAADTWTTLKDITPDNDGSFADMPTQARTTQYRVVPLSPVGSLVQQILDVIKLPLIESDAVKVDTQGTVTLKGKRAAKGTWVYSGKATPGTAGQVVTLVTKKGKKVSTLATTTTAADGTYSVAAPKGKGRKAVVAVTTATPDALGASSSRAAGR